MCKSRPRAFNIIEVTLDNFVVLTIVDSFEYIHSAIARVVNLIALPRVLHIRPSHSFW